jgi:hypothetical protein
MDETLRAKLDEARERMNSKQAGINANRKHDDSAVREWARGKTATSECGTGSVQELADR